MSGHTWLFPEPAPDPHRPNLLVYSSCHTHGIVRYLNHIRPVERANYNLTAIVIHEAFEADALNLPEFQDPFHAADIILNHPLSHGPKWDAYKSEAVGLRPSCLRVTMESPQMASAWPICNYSGEVPVVRLLEVGHRIPEIQRRFDAGQFDCCFAERHAADIARMYERDEHTDLKAAAFVEENWTRQKMFFTENHPTMPVLGFMVDQFLGMLGHKVLGAEHALALPLDTMEGDNHYPETDYEWQHYGFQYPQRFPKTMGGKQHYHRIIQRITDAWLARARKH